MKYIIAALAILSLGGFGLFTYFNDEIAVGGGTGTLNQLDQWRNDGVRITQNIASTTLKLTGYESSGSCLVTDSNGVVSTSTCGGGGSSKWTDEGTIIYPTTFESIRVPFIAASSTNATSTFAGDVFIDGVTRLATSLSGVLRADNGRVTTNATGTLTENATGLEFSATRDVLGGSSILSLTSGYSIPLTASTTEWATAYASTTALTPTYIRGLFSNTATGLTYTSGTGVTALTSGYSIPLTASTTEWAGFYSTPSTRITAGTNLSWSGNTLNSPTQISTSSTAGNLAFWTGTSALGNVATGTLTETATGLELSATRALVGGASILSLTSGYNIPLTASTTNWESAYTSSHAAVTLAGALDYITLAGQVITRGAIDLATDITGVLGIAAGGLGAAFTDPNADQIMFFDDSSGFITGITSLVGAAISGTTLTINDVTCTDCLTSTEIADEYLFNTGDVGTGVYDFGGATSFEIVNGTAPTVDTLGEIALDTTDNQLLVATGTSARAIPTITKIWGATIASTSNDFPSGGRLPLPPHRDGVVITEVHCFVDGGTSKVINIDTQAGGAQLDSLTCGTTLTSDTAQSANNTLSAGALMALEFGATTGTVDYVTFSAWGYIIAE